MAIDYSKMSVYGDTYGTTEQDQDQDQETGIGEILIPNINTSYSGLNSGNNNQYYNNNQLTALRDNALATRQERLNNPGMLQGIINSGMKMIGMTPQRSIEQMITSGEKDVRNTSGIPLGIGQLISRALPSNYYDKMTLADQIFTQSQMTNKALPTVFDSGNSIANRDEFGINKRSMFGNYGEYGKKQAIDLDKQLTKIGEKYGATWDAALGEFTSKGETKKQKEAAAFANKQTTMMKAMFSKYDDFKYQYSNINDKINVAKQAQDIKEKKIAKEAQEKIVQQLAQEKIFAAKYGKSDPNDQSRTGSSGRRPGSGSGPTTQDSQSRGDSSAGQTGGYSYDSGGREGFGYGLKDGGRIRYGKGGIVSL